MDRKISINLGNLLLSLSEVTDLANPAIAQHQLRTAFIALEMAKAADIHQEALKDLFAAALLHDMGAISVEEKIKVHNFDEVNIEDHCMKGALLFHRCSLFKNIPQIVRHHHKPWREWERAEASVEDQNILASQILFFADHIERFISRNQYILHQAEGINERASSLAPDKIHKQVYDHFCAISHKEEFWLDLTSQRLYSIMLSNNPYVNVNIELDAINDISELFRDIIDFKSRFTATHSVGVASCGEIISKIFGLTELEVQLMKVAGNLHDVGKMIVPNAILEKPDKLTKEEYEIIRCHTYYTYYVINTIGGLRDIAEWAAYHHERLDASGYPFHCTAKELSIGSRIMQVADIFTAIAEDRPYRLGMSRESTCRILSDFASRGVLDKRITGLVLDNYEQIKSYVSAEQFKGKEFYENFSAQQA